MRRPAKSLALLVWALSLQSAPHSCQQQRTSHVLISKVDYEAFFQTQNISREAVKHLCSEERNRCVNHCGEKAKPEPGTLGLQGRASCSCDSLCLVYADCCWDFHDACPDQVALYHKSHLRQASSTCIGIYNHLMYGEPTARRGSHVGRNLPRHADGTAPVHRPYVSFEEIHKYMLTVGVSVTDTQTGELYKGLQDFASLNPSANTSQPGRLAYWSPVLAPMEATPLSSVLAYIIHGERDIGFFVIFEAPPGVAEQTRTCPGGVLQNCVTEHARVKADIKNLTLACQVLFDGAAKDFPPGGSATALWNGRESDQLQRIHPIEAKESTTSKEGLPVANESSEETDAHRQCAQFMYFPPSMTKSIVLLSFLLNMDTSAVIVKSLESESPWSEIRCSLDPSGEDGSENQNYDYSRLCQARLLCANGFVSLNDSCMQPTLMMLEAEANNEARTVDFLLALQSLVALSRLFNHPELALWQNPSSCVTRENETLSADNTFYYGAYHIISSNFSNSDTNHLPMVNELTASVLALQAQNQALLKQIRSLRLCFLMATGGLESSGDNNAMHLGHSSYAEREPLNGKTNLSITGEVCQQMPSAWAHIGSPNNPRVRCGSVIPLDTDGAALGDVFSSETQVVHPQNRNSSPKSLSSLSLFILTFPIMLSGPRM